MSKTAQKSAGPVTTHPQDSVKSKPPARDSVDHAKKPAGKPDKSATVKQASSTKGHQ